MPPRRKEAVFTIEDALKELTMGLKQQSTRPNIYGYKPHTKQELFHKSEAKKKLYIGGNRSGKTTGSVVEDIWWLMGNHPYRKTPEGQIRGRIVAVDFNQGVQKIVLPEVARWIPPSALKNGSWEDSYNKELRTLTLENGNFVEFMSYDQDTDKFAGTSRHFIHYDEEPPRHVFNECNARLVDTNGSYWISMTPVEGMTWIYDTIYVPGTEGGDKSIFVIEADMLDNPHISKEAAESFLSGLDDAERKAREHGNFVQLGGRVYKNFSRTTHVVPSMVPDKSWEWYISLDHGYNNPTAALWHAVSPDNQVITFAEHYASEMVVEEHAAKIHSVNSAFGKIPEIWVADPAIAQRSGITGTSVSTEYAERGCYFAPGNNDVQVGIARVSQYLRTNPSTGKPRWLITESCVNLIREMERLRWKTYSSKKLQYENNAQEQIHKKDDHAADSARYFFTFMPDLTPTEFAGNSEPTGIEFPAVTPNSVGPAFDNMLSRIGAPNQLPEGATDIAEILTASQGNETKWETVEGSSLSAMEWGA
jgi:phage terminase large subunit-like protein